MFPQDKAIVRTRIALPSSSFSVRKQRANPADATEHRRESWHPSAGDGFRGLGASESTKQIEASAATGYARGYETCVKDLCQSCNMVQHYSVRGGSPERSYKRWQKYFRIYNICWSLVVPSIVMTSASLARWITSSSFLKYPCSSNHLATVPCSLPRPQRSTWQSPYVHLSTSHATCDVISLIGTPDKPTQYHILSTMLLQSGSTLGFHLKTFARK